MLGVGDAPSQAALDRLELEHDSIRAALGWLLDSGEIEQAAEMIVEAWWFWFTHGHLAIGRFWSTRALERLGPELTPLRLRLSIAAGWFIEAMGELDLARAMQTDGLALARQLGDPFSIGIALYALADVIDEHWDVQRALVLFSEAAEVFRALGTITWLSATLNSIGAAHRESGAYDQAVAAVEESLALARTCEFTWMVAHSTSHLARIYSIRGDLERAIAFDRETIPLWHDLGDWWRLSRTITEFGIVIERTGQFEYATRLLAGSEAMREQLNVAFMTLLTPAWERSLANLHRHLSDTAFAEAWQAGRSLSLDELLALAMTSPEPPARVAQHDTTATAGLSSREMDVLRLLVAGHSDRQIAEDALHQSPDRPGARRQHLQQTRRQLPDGGRDDGHPAGARQ